jgi:PAS domain S-box-containing protein
MGDGVLVCDQDGSIVLTNPAANHMFQVSEDDLLGKLLTEAHLPPELASAIDKSLKTTESAFTSISQELSLGAAEEVHLRAHTAPVRNDVGEIMGAVTVFQDISYLRELDKMKSEFIAMVTHELRAPIAAVEQQLTVILNKMAGEVTEKQEQLLSRAKERTKGLLDLIKDLLDLSKIEAGKMVQYKEPLSLPEVIQRVVDLMRAEAEHKKIDLQFSAPSETPVIHADRNSMEEIFTNLISNAIKYTPEQGKVRIVLGEEKGFVKASVSDTGIGIEEKDLSRIFDKFYRVKTAETRQIVGTGLGLSIVKSIVAAHLGSISVESNVGAGSTFTVLLPKESTPMERMKGKRE